MTCIPCRVTFEINQDGSVTLKGNLSPVDATVAQAVRREAARQRRNRNARARSKAPSFVERERLGSIRAVEDMLATARAAYRSALKHDKLPEGTKFAVFSDANPFVVFYERALAQFYELRAACAAHGYCGLSMRNRDVYRCQ